MEDKDEHALEGVKGGEEVGHDYCVLIDEEEAEGPCQSQQEQQSNGSQSPRPNVKAQKLFDTQTGSLEISL